MGRPMPLEGPLEDAFGRRIRNLRVSLIDRCNFRCTYCMPAEGLEWLPRDEILTFDEIERLVSLAVTLGIDEIRLTGGEPTLRPQLPELIARLSAIPGLKSLALTTNGFLLRKLVPDLAAAGLTRINVSLDTLDAHKFAAITRRNAIKAVLDGLEALEEVPSIHPIKVNAVAVRGFTTADDILAFAELARRKPYVIRFIEFMPLDADGHWDRMQVLSGDEIRRHYRGGLSARAGAGRGEQHGSRIPLRRRQRRDGLHQSREPAVLRLLRPHSPHRRRATPDLPILH